MHHDYHPKKLRKKSVLYTDNFGNTKFNTVHNRLHNPAVSTLQQDSTAGCARTKYWQAMSCTQPQTQARARVN